MASITLEGLSKAFGDFVAVRETTLTIDDGEFFVLLGPSGCGKTTTLRMIAGLESASAGRILLDGRDVTGLRPSRRDIAFVFQLFALYPHMSAYDNLAYPLRSQHLRQAEIRRRVADVAAMLRIDHLLRRKVGRLSGGDQQRIALGRAIIRRPRAFLLDEPLGTLDTEFRELMCHELSLLHKEIRTTAVYVTHDQIEAMAMGDRIAVMNGGEILQVGAPDEVYNRPRTTFVASFIGSPAMNFLPAEGGLAPGARSIKVNGATIRVPRLHEGLGAARALLGVRPEHVVLGEPGALRGTVFAVEYLGPRQLLTVDTSAGRLKVRTPNTTRAGIGETVGLDFRPEGLIVFDPDTGRALASDLIEERDGRGRTA